MDVTDLAPLIDQLDDNIDDLHDSVQPLLQAALSDTAAKLPLLDKAKLYVLVTYALESILFSFLRLNSVKAKEHPIFRELARVKQYFDKLKHVENTGSKRENLSLDKQAAGRFIKHALAGNTKFHLERAEQQAKIKAKQHIRFQQLPKKRKAGQNESLSGDEEDHSLREPQPQPRKPTGLTTESGLSSEVKEQAERSQPKEIAEANGEVSSTQKRAKKGKKDKRQRLTNMDREAPEEV